MAFAQITSGVALSVLPCPPVSTSYRSKSVLRSRPIQAISKIFLAPTERAKAKLSVGLAGRMAYPRAEALAEQMSWLASRRRPAPGSSPEHSMPDLFSVMR